MPASEAHAVRVFRQTARDAVVVKPAGMSSEAPGNAATRAGGPTLIEAVRALLEWPDAQLPHRLDRLTRGLVVVARDRDAVAAHNQAIREGLWVKHYLARCKGGANADVDAARLVGPHSAYLRRVGKVARVVRSGGDPASLRVLATAPAPGRAGEFHALIRLETGRFHQIRAMLAHGGAPLVGDVEYGGAVGPYYLEHASLTFPDLDTGKPTRLFDAHDPEREPIDQAMAAALAGVP